MSPKKKEPPEGNGGKGGQEDKESKGGRGKGKSGDVPTPVEEGLPAEEELPPGELPGPPSVVTPEFIYNKSLTIEQLQEIHVLSAHLEDAARYLAAILGLRDCVFDARNLTLLEYCLGNLMFAKHAGLNLNQSLVIYDLGHMILDLIRAGNPFADAERLFKNRLLSLSIVQYKTVAPDQHIKDNDKPKEGEKLVSAEKPKDGQKPNDAEQQESKKSKGTQKKKKSEKTKEAKKAKDAKKEPVDGDKVEEPEQPKQDDEKEDASKQEEPLFSPFDLQKITPYFTTTVFQHYCLYQYCFTKVHYNIRRQERVLIETAMTYPLSEAKSQEEVDAEEAARVAAIEKARQDEHAAKVRAEQDMFDSLAEEAKRLAEEELARKALTLDEYIELAVRHKIEAAKKSIIEEYEYREHFLIDKILHSQKEQATAAALAAKNAAIADKTTPSSGKTQPVATAAAGKKKGK